MKAAWIGLAFVVCTAGLGWLALAMEVHWRQVRGGTALPRARIVALRVGGAVALLASLAVCLRADHASMAALVWVMLLAAAALTIAFVLSWRPRWLAPLVAWAGR